jgi:hypothetical protein
MHIITRTSVIVGSLLAGLAVPRHAHAMQLCVVQDKATGAIKEGSRITLRETCRPREKALAISIEDGETTVRISGANLKLDDGSGSTTGPANGLGNLVIGYDEGRCYDEEGRFARTCVAGEQCDFAPCDVSAKNGSHNLVVGAGHQYGSVGGFIAGEGNVVAAPTASVSGGWGNRAAGYGATIAGGSRNLADQATAVIAGGSDNRAHGASIFGGEGNVANGRATIVGGRENSASALSLAAGGAENAVHGDQAVVVGGLGNRAPGSFATVAGGVDNEALGTYAAVCGGGSNVASGQAASVSGGGQNVASGPFSAVSGGRERTASGEDNWVAGSLFEPN